MGGKVGALLVLFVLLFSSMLVLPLAPTAGAAVFEGSVPVNTHETGTQKSARIAVDQLANISVVWEDLHDGRMIFYGRSDDGGATFMQKVRVDDVVDASSNRSSPAVAVNDSGSIFVVWNDARNGASRIYFSKSDDNGSSFSTNIPIDPSGLIVQTEPDIAIANETIFVVWVGTNLSTPGLSNIFMARSVDWGQTFLSIVNISDTGTSLITQGFPSIAAMDNIVFVTWHDSRTDSVFDIYGVLSNDSGSNFGANVKVSDGIPGTRQARPDAAILPDGNPCAVWHDDRSGDLDIRFARSADNGVHFLPSVLVSDSIRGTSHAEPQIAVDSKGNISVIFRDNSLHTYHVMYSGSHNSGASFSSGILVDNAPLDMGSADSIDLALSPNGTPMVVYDFDFTGSRDIYFTKMIDRPPLCSITFPIDEATIAGNVTVLGNASDPDGNETLVMVEARVHSVGGLYDSGWKVANGTVGWNYTINTTALINGPYEISARSYDGEAYSETALIQVTVFNEGQKWPDLAITANDIVFSPNLPEESQLVNISAAVWNIGNLNATDVNVRFYRENSLIGETQTSLVPYGENRTAGVQWQALPGNHLIKVIVDPDNIIVELNETNNQASKMVGVVPSTFYQPDLEISPENVTLSSDEIGVGDSVNLTAEVFNFGNKGATNVAVVFTVDGDRVGEQMISYVPVNNSRSAKVTWVATVGHHIINITVDPTNQIVERNESNNRASISVDVTPVGGDFPVWIIVVGVAIPLVLALAITYVMKWRRPKY
ncbi:MAG: hypothetical protein LUO84_00410 [Methanomassiliicoccales archaeon]|nr:hypothetical protein [Methanomassiliicoccales archaeon]